jgi:hypothetical protein
VSVGSRTSGKELRLFATGSAPVTAYTNGIERVRIDGAGNLGVGTPSPSELVEVKDGNLLLSNSGTAGMLELQGTSSGVSTLTAGAQGTTTIHYTLPTSAPSANDVLTAMSVSGSGPYAVTLGWSASSGVGSGWGLSGNAITSGQVLGTTNAQDLALETNSSERLRVTSAGAVGIGTPSPNQKLEVKNGNVLLSNTGTAAQIQLQGTGSGTTSLQAGAQGATNITYTLPTSQGVSGSTLQNNGSGTLSWSRVGQVLFGRRTENFNVTSTSLQSDTSLVVTLDSNAVYTFETLLSLSDPNGAGVTYAYTYTVPAGSTIKWGFSDPSVDLSTTQSIVTASATTTSTFSLNGTKEMYYPSAGVVITGSTPGTLQFKLRKVGGGTATDPVRLNVNSYLMVTRVQ